MDVSILRNDKIAKHNLIYCALKIQSTKIDVKRENREINIADCWCTSLCSSPSRFSWYAFNMEFISCNLAKVTRGVYSWELFCWLTNGGVIYGAIVHAIWHRKMDKNREKCIQQHESSTTYIFIMLIENLLIFLTCLPRQNQFTFALKDT